MRDTRKSRFRQYDRVHFNSEAIRCGVTEDPDLYGWVTRISRDEMLIIRIDGNKTAGRYHESFVDLAARLKTPRAR